MAAIKLNQSEKKRIVILGGGFAGLNLAKELKNTQYEVLLVDKNNYHTFQPLLYQVATGALEPDSIAAPFRDLFATSANIFFRMTEAIEILPPQNKVVTSIGEISYDFLVIATGATTNYFDRASIAEYAMPLKSIPDALDLRSMFFQNLESTLNAESDDEYERLIDIIVVGGGPTGVETAGALAELRKDILPKDFREIDFKRMDIYLIQRSPRLLPTMSEQASANALKYLSDLGVKVLLNTGLNYYDGSTAFLDNGAQIPTHSLIYAAGVKGNIINGLDSKAITKGRITVDGHLKVSGYENIYAIGDVAAMITKENPTPQPMVAPTAIQHGKYLGKYFQLIPKSEPAPFKYFDKGSMATVGKNKAVADIAKLHFGGLLAWLTWIFVHLMFLVGFKNRISVFLNWSLSYFSSDKHYRLIIRPFNRKKVA